MDTLTISILAYNNGKVLEECVKAVLSQKLPEEYEIQIIDNGTDDSTSAILNKYEIDKVIHTDNKYGFITGVNKSFEWARNNLVLFLSYDVILFDSDLSNLNPLSKSIEIPIIYDMDSNVQNTGMKWYWPGYGISTKHLSNETDIFTTTAFLMTKQSFQNIGDFDEQFAPA